MQTSQSTAPLVLRLLGDVQLTLGGAPIVCGSRKSLALFVYLVLVPRRHRRTDVAALLWGTRDPEAARTSLRTALQRLPTALAAALDAQRETIGLADGAQVEVDAGRFESLAASEDLDELEQASQLYAGELLKGLDADGAPGFEDWLVAERVRLRQLSQAVFDRLIAQYRDRAWKDAAAQGAARASAMATARRWLSVDPASEQAHRWLMQLLIETGQPEAARAQYEVCRRALAVTHGRAPSGEVRALYDSLIRETTPQRAGAAAMPGDLHLAAVPDTPFVGRVDELAALDQLLAQPDCRLLTLHGLGGCGKTRLAHVLAQQVKPRFAQGATWVGLEGASDVETVALLIARALGVEGAAARSSARSAICDCLSAQQRLLVLDNVEHLLTTPALADALTELFLAMLAAAPRLKLVVTSREVLGLADEWVYQIGGLRLPTGDTAGSGLQGAADLFVQRARQAYLGFSPAAEWPHIERICRLVDGLPLGLELAAAWVRTVPCGEIATSMERELGALSGATRQRPLRQRSLEAVFEYSWALLDQPLQNVLAGLSVFIGSFTHDAARGVADASLRQLSGLIDKSLVQRRDDGRLQLHPLVRQFAAARLTQQPERLGECKARHAVWFIELLARLHARVEGPEELDAEAELTTERDEITLAFDYWFERGDAARIDASAVALLRMLFVRGAVGETAARGARLASFKGLSPETIAMAMAFEGRALGSIGDMDGGARVFVEAERYAREHGLGYAEAFSAIYAVSIKQARGDLHGMQTGLEELRPRADAWPLSLKMRYAYILAVAFGEQGRIDDAIALMAEARRHADQSGSPISIATCASSQGEFLIHTGEVGRGRALASQALEIFRRAGRRHEIARVQCVLGVAALGGGDFVDAEARIRSSAALFHELGIRRMARIAEVYLAQALLGLARYDEAIALCRAILDDDAIDVTRIVEARYCLVRASLATDRMPEARAEVQAILDVVDEGKTGSWLAHRAVLAVAHLAAKAGLPDAAELARAVLADAGIDADLRDEAEQIAGKVKSGESVELRWVDWSARSREVLARAIAAKSA
jgi:predicted ATPase/DNA-binding SARP family transcriptional activator